MMEPLLADKHRSSTYDALHPHHVNQNPYNTTHPYANRLSSSNYNNISSAYSSSSTSRYFNSTNKKGVAVTLANNLKQYIGAGILGLPYAFSQTGLVASLVVLVVMVCLTDHCIKMLLRCREYIIENRGEAANSYGAVAYVCLGKYGELLVNFLMVFTCGGACTIYLIFIGKNLREFYSDPDMKVVTEAYWILITCVPLIAISFFPSVKHIAPLSAVATLTVIIGIVSFMGYSIDKVKQEKPIIEVEPWNIPYFAAVLLFAFDGAILAIPLQSSMSQPSKFILVENLSCVILAILYSVFGAVGYLAYGNKTEAVITINIPFHNRLCDAITACLCFSVFVSHTLFSRPIIEVFEMYIKIPSTKSSKCEKFLGALKFILLRIIVVITTGALAIAFPHLGSVLGVTGALAGSSYQLILPTVFHLSLFYSRMDMKTYIKDIAIIAVGLMIGVLGFLSSIGVLRIKSVI